MARELLEIFDKIIEDLPELETLVLKLRLRKIAEDRLSFENILHEIKNDILNRPDGLKLELIDYLMKEAYYRLQLADKLFEIAFVITSTIKADEDKRRALRYILWTIDVLAIEARDKARILERIFPYLKHMNEFDRSEVIVTFSYVVTKFPRAFRNQLLLRILDEIKGLKDYIQTAKALQSLLDFAFSSSAYDFLKEKESVIMSIISNMPNERMRKNILRYFHEIMEKVRKSAKN